LFFNLFIARALETKDKYKGGVVKKRWRTTALSIIAADVSQCNVQPY